MGAEEKRLVSVRVIGELRHPRQIVMRRLGEGLGFEPDLAGGSPLSELLRKSASLRVSPAFCSTC
jgi:hypothetical protein